jgi:DUF1365 family protein
MNSCLYECSVMHARLSPRRHAFRYRIFLFAIDLDEIAAPSRWPAFFSVQRRNVYSFREADYLPVDEKMFDGRSAAAPVAPAPAASLKQRVIAYAAKQGVELDGGRVVLVTLPRVFGYLFNPVSFYFCFDRQGRPVATIAEVTNTFREMKPYFLAADARVSTTGEFHWRTPKHFYVSPYSDVDVAFDFALRCPCEQLSVQIDDYAGGQLTLTTRLSGTRRELTSARLAWFTGKYPLLTLRIITLIHWHALLLWAKRVPWFAKAARASEQRGLFRPHHSLQPPDVA